MISLKVHPTSQNLPCCCKVLTGDLSCQLLLPKFLFAMKACVAVLERGSRSAAFSGLLSLGKLPGSSNRSCICDFDVGSPSPQPALGGVGLSHGWEAALGGCATDSFQTMLSALGCSPPAPGSPPAGDRASEVRSSPTHLGDLGY